MSPIIKHDYLGSLSIALDPSLPMDQAVLRDGVWEVEVLQTIDWFVRPGSVVLDIGANSGLITLALALQVGKSGFVYAFEPDPVAYRRLSHNLQLNPALDGWVQAFQLGLSNRKEELRVYHSHDAGNAYLNTDGVPKYGNQPDIESNLCSLVPADDLPLKRPISFMKVDVENMELEVLMGAKGILNTDRPIIVYETLLSCFDHEKIKAVENFLLELGYIIFVKAPKGKLFPTSYPNYSEDSIAIHRVDIASFANTLLNAARYEILPEDPAEVSDLPPISFWLGAVFPEQPLLKIGPSDLAFNNVAIHDNKLRFSWTDRNNEPHEIELELSLSGPMLKGCYRGGRNTFRVAARCREGSLSFL